MTRLIKDAIEYQFVYLPKSSSKEDFTVLDWTADFPALWDRLLSLLEGQKRSLSMFELGPWSLFGVTSKQVQARIATSGTTKSTGLTGGILHCFGWDDVPSVQSYRAYLGMSEEEVEKFDWIVGEMMGERIPPHYTQHVSDHNMYWVDNSVGGASTWKHPFFEKYSKMLDLARKEKPLTHWRSVTIFQLRFMFAHSAEFRTESLGSLLELGRIFKTNLAQEPFLIHTFKRMFRHFLRVESISLETSSRAIDDFLSAIDRERQEDKALAKAVDIERTRLETASLCVECGEATAVQLCRDCGGDIFCDSCFSKIHSTGSRQSHCRSQICLAQCAECATAVARLLCTFCGDSFCDACFVRVHARGGRRSHAPVVVRTKTLAARNVPELERKRSPWVRLADTDSVPLYVNLVSLEQRRDQPMAVLNEPPSRVY